MYIVNEKGPMSTSPFHYAEMDYKQNSLYFAFITFCFPYHPLPIIYTSQNLYKSSTKKVHNSKSILVWRRATLDQCMQKILFHHYLNREGHSLPMYAKKNRFTTLKCLTNINSNNMLNIH